VIVKWRHGPVVENVYTEFGRFIGRTINEEQIECNELVFDDDFKAEDPCKYTENKRNITIDSMRNYLTKTNAKQFNFP